MIFNCAHRIHLFPRAMRDPPYGKGYYIMRTGETSELSYEVVSTD